MTAEPGEQTDSLSILFELFAASQAARALLGTALRGSPLKPDEYAVYSVLVDPGLHTPTTLRRRLGMPAPTLSDYLALMTERRHLIRSPNPDDARSTHLDLTASGRAAHRATAQHFEPAIRAVLDELRLSPARLRAGLVDLREAATRAARALDGH